jgi:hypothetical protein
VVDVRLFLVALIVGALNASASEPVDRAKEPALWADQLTGDSAALTEMLNNAFAKQFPAMAARNAGRFAEIDQLSDLLLASSFISPNEIYFRVIHFHLIAQPTKDLAGMVMVTPSNGGLDLFFVNVVIPASTGN